jgi:rod shape-determining protein MreC
VVSIFTYRDERKLFAVIGAVVAAAAIALVQLDSLKTGKPSLIAVAVGSAGVYAETATSAAGSGLRGALASIANAPRLTGQNAELRAKNEALRAENQRLREAIAAAPEAQVIATLRTELGSGTSATVVGFDPEETSRTVTLDRGADAGVKLDDGVLDEEGVVGRVIGAGPGSSTVLLVTDGASKVPAVVQRGRWWGIAIGTDTSIRLEYVSQDAKLKIGDDVVTGEGRSFHAGFELGRIARIDHPEGALYQSAVITPAVAFGRLSRVLVVAK